MNLKVRRLVFGIWIGIVIVATSCNEGPDVPNEYETLIEQIETIDANLTAQGVPYLKDPSGVRIIINKLGTKLPAQLSNKVDVDYIGRRFTDKVEFDRGTTNLTLSSYISGWGIALSKLPAGTEATIIIPSLYGYGTTGTGSNIPPNTILEFDITFYDVINSSAEVQKLASDVSAIDTYLTGKAIDAIKDTTGIRYVITAQGIGQPASWYDKITMKYTIKLLTDDANSVITLDRAPDEEFYSRPVDYIHGLKIGLQKLSIGSKAVLYIPSGYAFGPAGASDQTGASVPANSNIIIEIEVTDIE